MLTINVKLMFFPYLTNWKPCSANLNHVFVVFFHRENETEEVKEEGPKEMTLDEWKAQQDKERAKVEFNIRKANEGADWNKGYVLHKSKADDVCKMSCVLFAIIIY